MSVPRFFVEAPLTADAVGREIDLPHAPAHHALRVLRLGVGDALTLFTGAGGEFAATLVRADKRSAAVRIDAFAAVERESAVAVTLVQGIAANDAMDFVVRKAVELGVAVIQPVVTTRSARFPNGERGDKRQAHWRQIALAACEQCGRNRIPVVAGATDFAEWLAARGAGRAGIVLAPDAGEPLAALAAPTAALDVLVGPEGGFTADEIARAVRAGVTPVRMGPRILRTETAAVAALAAVHALWGDFR